MVVEDMKLKMDPKQYGNQKGLGIQHYLVEMLHRILSGVDNNNKGEITAVLCLFVDWKSAYSNQYHKLGVESFIENGVRPSLIPLIINYFQNREMKVKFREEISQSRKQPGSGAQGASLGNHEFLSQTNHNADIVPESDRFKFVDDLSCLEIINLLSIGLASHSSRLQVASDLPVHGQIIENTHLQSQVYLDEISRWTSNQKMLLNESKTKAMVVNFTNNYQFTTRLNLNATNIDMVDHMKILGTTINNQLDWNMNCKNIISKVNKRMVFLRKILSFGASQSEMVHLWKTYCRSVLEQSAVVWQGGLTKENRDDLERTQKTFTKLVLKNRYQTYEESLQRLNLTTLELRRDQICLKFALNCRKNERTKHLFPLDDKKQHYELRKISAYMVHNANTERLKRSPIIYMQNLLNKHHESRMITKRPG